MYVSKYSTYHKKYRKYKGVVRKHVHNNILYFLESIQVEYLKAFLNDFKVTVGWSLNVKFKMIFKHIFI